MPCRWCRHQCRGKPAIIRALWNDPAIPGQALDAGAVAVISPMINSRAEAEALVRAAKYPPIGGRSWGGYTALQASGLTPGEYLREANRMTMVFAMIETWRPWMPSATSPRPRVLDGLFVGPSDLSIALSRGAGIDKTAPRRWPPWRRWSRRAGQQPCCRGLRRRSGGDQGLSGPGFTFIAAAVDVDLLHTGAAALMKSLKGV